MCIHPDVQKDAHSPPVSWVDKDLCMGGKVMLTCAVHAMEVRKLGLTIFACRQQMEHFWHAQHAGYQHHPEDQEHQPGGAPERAHQRAPE